MSPVAAAQALWGLLTGLFLLFLWVAGPVLIVLAGLLMPLLMPIVVGIWIILAIIRALWEVAKILWRKVS